MGSLRFLLALGLHYISYTAGVPEPPHRLGCRPRLTDLLGIMKRLLDVPKNEQGNGPISLRGRFQTKVSAI